MFLSFLFENLRLSFIFRKKHVVRVFMHLFLMILLFYALFVSHLKEYRDFAIEVNLSDIYVAVRVNNSQ